MELKDIIVEPGLTLTRKLGEGASSVVFAAEAHVDSRFVASAPKLAVKLFRYPPTGKSKERFDRELRIGLELNSPYLVRYLGLGMLTDPLGDRPYIVMEHLEGISLKAYIQRLSESPAIADQRFRSLLSNCLRGLCALHSAGVIHRDVQPSNILITSDDRPVLLDFGTSKYFDTPDLTSIWEEIGTRRFWAPECLTPERARWWPSTDVFMLGSCMLFCLTGKYLFHEAKNYPSFYRALASKDTRVTSEFDMLPPWTSARSRFLLELMLNGEAKGRPSAETLISIADQAIPELPPLPSKLPSMEACVQQLYVLVASGQVDIDDAVALARLLASGAQPGYLTTEELEATCSRTSKFERVNLVGVLVDAHLLMPQGDWFDSVTSDQWLLPRARFSISARAPELEAAIETSPLWSPINLARFRAVAETLALTGTETLRLVCTDGKQYLCTEVERGDIISAIVLQETDEHDAVQQDVAADGVSPRS